MNETSTYSQENAVTHKDDNGSSANRKQQFGISAIFWATFVIALAISYMQNTDSTDVLLGGAVSVIIGVVVGSVVGIVRRKFIASLMWSTLIAAFGYICVSSDPIIPMTFRIAWAAIGATAGALAASCFNKRIGLNIVVSAVGALIVMTGFVLTNSKPMTGEMTMDLISAPIVGALVAVFVLGLTWFETKHSINRYFTATALMVMIVVGNAVANL